MEWVVIIKVLLNFPYVNNVHFFNKKPHNLIEVEGHSQFINILVGRSN